MVGRFLIRAPLERRVENQARLGQVVSDLLQNYHVTSAKNAHQVEKMLCRYVFQLVNSFDNFLHSPLLSSF